MKTKIFVLTMLVLSAIIPVTAQNTKPAKYATITGTVIDSVSGEKLSGVTIRIVGNDKKHLLGAITDNRGTFRIDRVTQDDASVQLSQVGYSTKTIIPFQDKQIKNADLGTIKMQVSAVQMSEVEIKSQRPMVEYLPDKQIINMEKIPGAAGSVTDALRNSGAVDIDPQSNKISVRGKSNVTIQIDGKPMPMAEDMLTQMPANMIDQVEIMANPSAKDDPEGDAGIINFITKKGMSDNYSGSLTMYRSSRNLNYISTFINFKKDKLTLFGSVNGGAGEFLTSSETFQNNYNSTALYKQYSSGDGSREGFMTNAKIGLDYDFDTLNTLSLSGTFFKMKGDGFSHDTYRVYDNTEALKYTYKLNNDGKLDNNVYSLTTNYKHKFDRKGHELTADVFFSYMDNEMPNKLTTVYDYSPSTPKLQNATNNTGSKTIISKLDYVNPATFIGKLETGYNFTIRDRNTEYDFDNFNYTSTNWEHDPNYSNEFIYKENIHAAYVSLADKIWVLDYKLGARAEQILSNGDVKTTGQKFDLNYSSFFPSVLLAYTIAPNFQATLNIARRIRRPQMEYINPFRRVNGPNNYTIGNPDLKPTYTNMYELGISPFIKTYYTTSTGTPVNLVSVVQDTTYSSMVNNASQKTYGAELTIPIMNDARFPFKLPDWLLMCNIQASYRRIEESNSYLQENYSVKRNTFNIGGNLSLKVFYDVNLVFFGRYTPEVKDARSVYNARAFVGVNLSKEFMNKKLKINLTAQDLLKANRNQTQTYGAAYYSDSKFTNYSMQNISISLTYMFNDFKARQERNIDDGRDKSDNGMF
ncbi:MAG: TonB-dependent receptor [Ignavibacteriales bacterium]|nr:TonB-dependent receptor [Ignavibacteriales bacterium]